MRKIRPTDLKAVRDVIKMKLLGSYPVRKYIASHSVPLSRKQRQRNEFNEILSDFLNDFKQEFACS